MRLRVLRQKISFVAFLCATPEISFRRPCILSLRVLRQKISFVALLLCVYVCYAKNLFLSPLLSASTRATPEVLLR
uniref:Uncharacterized protein n=1 Tax=Pararge aegeria TaxID=116150 RepID=S4PWP5_9NEOP